MSKTAKIILATIIAVFGGFLIFIVANRLANNPSADFSEHDAFTVYVEEAESETTGADGNIKIATADETMGKIPDHVKGGDLSQAKVVLFEYADYQCSGCAVVNPWVNTLLESYDGDVVVVFRSAALFTNHTNARAAAAAVSAAGLQGYWKEMSDILFANQEDWYYATTANRTPTFVSYFEEASEGKGDAARFREDLSSSAVSSKNNFDAAMTERLSLTATPSFFLNGEILDWAEANTEPKFLEYFKNILDPLVGA